MGLGDLSHPLCVILGLPGGPPPWDLGGTGMGVVIVMRSR